ncbi:MAG: glycosyltransferase family 9 protein [Syntrophobacteraceae bacterium]|jgi:ADP-heptose:LPS heptosyltransferase
MTASASTEKIRAVVFHQGALGDFLMAASAIDELAEDPAWARIDFWSKPEHVSLLTGKSYLGECHSAEGVLIACLLQDSLWRSATLPGFLLEADHVLIFGQTGSRLLAERLSARLSANVNLVQSFPVANSTHTHVSQFLRRQLNDLGWPLVGKPLTLSPPVSEKLAARDLLRGLGICSQPIVIHPGSGGRRKVWPLRNWHGLLDWLRRELSFQALLSNGPADEYMDEFSEAMREAGVPTVSGLSPLRLSALLSLCGLYIGSDSGVSHLAAAVGIPTISVFGPTDPRVWAPRGENAVAVHRKWKEGDVFTWAPSEKPDFQDKEIAGLVLDMILIRPSVQEKG